MSAKDHYDFDKYNRAESAVKDILYMYRVCCDYEELYDDFGTEDGQYDPFLFVDCTPESIGGNSDLQLLQEGSAINIACRVLQSWSQGGYPKEDTGWTKGARKLIASNRMDHLPELKKFIKTALASNVAAKAKSKEIYKKYVAGYFRRISGATQ